GFVCLRGLFADSIAEITDEFESVWARVGAQRPHDGTKRSIYMPFIDQSELLSRLIDDPRLHDVATAVLGEDFNYVGCDGNFSVGDTGWHHDGREQLRFIRFFFYLDPLDAASGALRVIPGTHKLGDAFADGVVEALGPYDESAQDDFASRPERRLGVP